MVTVGTRAMLHNGIGSDGLYVQRWARVLQDTAYNFVRVEDGNRNAYVEVFREGVRVHLWHFKATGPKTGLQNISETLGKLISF